MVSANERRSHQRRVVGTGRTGVGKIVDRASAAKHRSESVRGDGRASRWAGAAHWTEGVIGCDLIRLLLVQNSRVVVNPFLSYERISFSKQLGSSI